MCGVVVLFLTNICDRKIRQEVHKASLGLSHEGIAVRQEQNVPDPTLFQQHFHQGNNRPRLSGAGSHDQQRFPPVLLPKSITDCLDSGLLIITIGNIFIYHHVFQAAAHVHQIEVLFQIALRVDGRYLSLRILVIHNACLKAVRQKHYRPSALLFLNQIRIEFRLLASFRRIHTGALRLDHSENTPIVTH